MIVNSYNFGGFVDNSDVEDEYNKIDTKIIEKF